MKLDLLDYLADLVKNFNLEEEERLRRTTQINSAEISSRKSAILVLCSALGKGRLSEVSVRTAGFTNVLPLV